LARPSIIEARTAASGSSGLARPSSCWRAYSSSCSQRCNWRRPSTLMAWPKLWIGELSAKAAEFTSFNK